MLATSVRVVPATPIDGIYARTVPASPVGPVSVACAAWMQSRSFTTWPTGSVSGHRGRGAGGEIVRDAEEEATRIRGGRRDEERERSRGATAFDDLQAKLRAAAEVEPGPVPVPEPEPPHPGAGAAAPEPTPDGRQPGADGPRADAAAGRGHAARTTPRTASADGRRRRGARLVAMKMALDGASREEIEAHLAEKYAARRRRASCSTTSSRAPPSSRGSAAPARERPFVSRTLIGRGSLRADRHLGRPRAQPEGRRRRAAARRAGRGHRALRLGQVEPRLRHDLRRGPAPLRRVALGLRAPVPRPDGEARRRLDRGPLAGDLDRPEDDLAQPALDRRHGDRDLRLPAPALGADRQAALPQLRRADRRASRSSRSPTG